ncbi:pectate lyase-like [Gossypium raimondii]|uniref:pectate lyase-like n=1 Tax=Gossypium raimondii TaxID=29730 RepID=UPI00227B3DFA|nr:pectate lyase-like [Gossypium raimondii]
MCIILEDGLNDEIWLAIVLPVENKEEVPVRKKLSNCVPGFARGTTGGKAGEFYMVTNPIDNATDPKHRTLLHAITQPRSLWITFKGSMTITLESDLIVTSDKTINARNVIIHGLQIHHNIPAKGGKIKDGENHHRLRGASDEDEVSLFKDTNISFDHLSLHHCTDVIQEFTAVTISNCHFTDDNDRYYDRNVKMQVNVGLNHFGKGLVERMPRCRFSFIHVINNDYNHWFLYAIGSTSHPTNISQGNRYLRETPSGLWR